MNEDPNRTYTAWDLAGSWWWVGTYKAVIIGGRAAYEDATATEGGAVKLCRLEGLRQINRYVEHDTKLRLRKIVD